MADRHLWNQVKSLGLQPGVNSLAEYERRVVVGAAAAQVFLRDPETDAFQPETIRLVHRLTFGQVHPWAGTFRTAGEPAIIAGYVAADAGRIESELALLCAQNRRWENPRSAPGSTEKAVLVAFFHARFERIHPFRDGNGRVGRLLLSEQLGRLCGRSTIDWLAVRSRYLAGLVAANAGDLAPLANLLQAALGKPLIGGPSYSPFRIAPRMDAPLCSGMNLEDDLRWSEIDRSFWAR